jgi:nucleoid DNA-binding protein
MKKEILIKQIASEFNVDEIKVSEYFDSIFETLAVAFIKNKNVNISEFGKFKIKTKKDAEGEKQRTVLFSPVKKFADEINYNFSDLAPVQIRLLDSAGNFSAGGDYEDYEAEEILLIEFDEEPDKLTEEVPPQQAEILITEEEKPEIPLLEKRKEEILIPEQEKPEMPTLEAEKKDKEILIHEAVTAEIPAEKIPEEEKSVEFSLEEERKRIAGEIEKIKFPEKIFVYNKEELKPVEILSAAKKTSLDSTLYIKEKPTEEKPQNIFVVDEIKTDETITPAQEEEKIDDEIEKLKALFSETKGAAEENKELPEAEVEETPKEETELPSEIKEADSYENISEEPQKEPESVTGQDVFPDETIYTEKENSEENVPEEIQEIPSDNAVTEQEENTETEKKDESEEEIPKTSLELEAELLQMLEERKKIIEEINKLENYDLEDVVDISGPKINGDDETPKLHDESTLDRPRQNIFVDEEGKIFEDLLNLISGDENPKTEFPKEGESITSEKEEIIPEPEKDEIKNIEQEEKTDDLPKEENKMFLEESGFSNLENILSGLPEKVSEPPEKQKEETPLQFTNNIELKVFDKLLNEPEEAPAEMRIEPEQKTEESELTSMSDLEEMFRNFKTEKSEDEAIEEKRREEIPEVKTPEEIAETKETIKTYDDISNLMGTEKPKEVEKPKETVHEEPQKKKLHPLIRLGILLGIVVLIIFTFIFIYEKLVYKSSESPKQLPISSPVDSTKTEGSDSVIYADTNKTADIDEETVFEKEDKVIKESPKGFYIEFGEFENQFVLAKEIKTLKDKGITPGYEEVKSEGKIYYKIKLGPYNSLKEAKSILQKL